MKYLFFSFLFLVPFFTLASGESYNASTNPLEYTCGTSDSIEIYNLTADEYVVGYADTDIGNCDGLPIPLIEGNSYEGNILLNSIVTLSIEPFIAVAQNSLPASITAVGGRILVFNGITDYSNEMIIVVLSVVGVIVGFFVLRQGLRFFNDGVVMSDGDGGYHRYGGDKQKVYEDRINSGKNKFYNDDDMIHL